MSVETEQVGIWRVVHEHDLEPDTVLATGFMTAEEAWEWAAEYSLYYSKKHRRYVFLRVDALAQGKASIPRVPKLYMRDARSWWKRLLDR